MKDQGTRRECRLTSSPLPPVPLHLLALPPCFPLSIIRAMKMVVSLLLLSLVAFPLHYCLSCPPYN